MVRKRKRIGILTGGGDCAGLNAVIRAVFRTAYNMGWEVLGIEESFGGLLDTKKTKLLKPRDVRGILHTGGTILGASNRGHPFRFPVKTASGVTYRDRSNEVLRNFRSLKLDGLVVVGGDGTLSIALALYRKGLPIVGVPKTIDNDLSGTVVTFGFDTAVSVATEALDRLHTTASSHRRVMVLEVMGRNVGWIALHAGVAGGADVILIPEIPFEIETVAKKIRERNRLGRSFSIVVVAEGATPAGGMKVFRKEGDEGYEGRLGGIGERVAEQIQQRTKQECRALVLGHLQRGGQPTNFDRLLGTRFGSAAVRLAVEGSWGQMVALAPPTIVSIPLEKAVSKLKRVPKRSDILRAARDLGVTFGDPVREV
jgi:6-phosphofructokinase 1